MPPDRTEYDRLRTPVFWLTTLAVLLLATLAVIVYREAWNHFAAVDLPSDKAPSQTYWENRAEGFVVMAAVFAVVPAAGLGMSIRSRRPLPVVLNGGILLLLVAFALGRLFS